MMIKLLRAWGAGITAFVNELSPFDFPILGDYAAGSLEHDLDDYEDDGYLLWPVEDSSVAASATEVGPGGDAPAPPGYPDTKLLNVLFNSAQGLRELAHSGASPNPASWWDGLADALLEHMGKVEEQRRGTAGASPDHRLMCAAANGLALWIESGTCQQPTYWGSIVRELGK